LRHLLGDALVQPRKKRENTWMRRVNQSSGYDVCRHHAVLCIVVAMTSVNITRFWLLRCRYNASRQCKLVCCACKMWYKIIWIVWSQIWLCMNFIIYTGQDTIFIKSLKNEPYDSKVVLQWLLYWIRDTVWKN
jgi:hypothetical protein